MALAEGEAGASLLSMVPGDAVRIAGNARFFTHKVERFDHFLDQKTWSSYTRIALQDGPSMRWEAHWLDE
jgi:hypothetical protein